MVELPLVLVLLSLIAIGIVSLYNMAGPTVHYVTSNYIGPGVLILIAIGIAFSLTLTLFEMVKLYNLKRRIKYKLPSVEKK